MIDLDSLQKSGFFSPLDLHFARFMAKVSKSPSQELMLAAALVSRLTREGHICLDLALHEPFHASEAGESLVFPEARNWGKTLKKSGVVGEPGEHRPLILDSRDRLYLYRYWDYEQCLAESIKERLAIPIAQTPAKNLRQHRACPQKRRDALPGIFGQGVIDDNDGQARIG